MLATEIILVVVYTFRINLVQRNYFRNVIYLLHINSYFCQKLITQKQSSCEKEYSLAKKVVKSKMAAAMTNKC